MYRAKSEGGEVHEPIGTKRGMSAIKSLHMLFLVLWAIGSLDGLALEAGDGGTSHSLCTSSPLGLVHH